MTNYPKAHSELQIPLPPLDVQQEIVAEIEGYQKVIDGARAVLDNYRPHIPIHPDWPMVELGEVCIEVNIGRSGAYLHENLGLQDSFCLTGDRRVKKSLDQADRSISRENDTNDHTQKDGPAKVTICFDRTNSSEALVW